MTRNASTVAISNNSWGPPDDGQLFAAPSTWKSAILSGLTNGRGGRGTMYVWAGGNGGEVFDTGAGTLVDRSSYDGFASFRGVIAVCAVDHHGVKWGYSEEGANLLVCAPSGDGQTVTLTTTDRVAGDGFNTGASAVPENYDDADYTQWFSGTSAAAPIASGVIALMLEANPRLSWRDVRILLAYSARQNDPSDTDWAVNGNGLPVNHKYGFGVIDADLATQYATQVAEMGGGLSGNWTTVAPAAVTVNAFIPEGDTPLESTRTLSSTAVTFTEFVEVRVTIDTAGWDWGQLDLDIVSPAGTVSELSSPRTCLVEVYDDSGNFLGYTPGACSPNAGTSFTFGVARHLGENPNGTWTLRARDGVSDDQLGRLASWAITVYGSTGGVYAD
jgi:kexin